MLLRRKHSAVPQVAGDGMLSHLFQAELGTLDTSVLEQLP